MKTGVAYLAVAGTAIVWSGVAGQLVTRVGVKPVLVTGMVALTAGLLFFTQVSVGGSYVRDLLPGFLHHRGRDRVLLRPDLDRGAGGSEACRGRAGVGADQHLSADRWRARDRRTVHDRHVTHRGLRRGGSALPVALVDGFSVRVPGRRDRSRPSAYVASLTLIRRDELEVEVVPEQVEPALEAA